MTPFSIDVRPVAEGDSDGTAAVAIRARDEVFTRLLRPDRADPDDFLLAAPAQLAFWLVDNWWRLRWEAVPPDGKTPEWRLAHELSSIGGGYVWPRLSIWGEGEWIGLEGQSD